MAERAQFTLEEQQLNLLLEESEAAGKHAKQLLLKVLAQKLPELPEIDAYNSEGFNMQIKSVYALPIEKGALGKSFAYYDRTIPEPEAFIAMTNEGIYRVQVRSATISTNMGVWAADWDEKQELTPLEYLALAPSCLQAIHDEAQKLVPVH